MSAIVLVTCDCGRRFPVNPNKHLNRNYRNCPSCLRPIQIRPTLSFSPNAKWLEQRESQRAEQRAIRAGKAAREMGLGRMLSPLEQVAAAYSFLLRKKQTEAKQE